MIEMMMEGQLEKESEREAFSELLKSICEKQQVKMEDYDTLIRIDVCPEGIIECSFEGKFISIAAQTNVAGPGFHACCARIFDDIMLESGIVFQVSDPTQYYENRDFEALKYKYFYPWLTTIASHIVEHRNVEETICICWPQDEYQPKGREGCVVTPMGYMRIDDFESKDVEELAEEFFIWNHEKRDGRYYLNCAMTLLWKECHFEYSLMNDASDKIANTIIDYLEAAYEADNLMELPYDIYEQLCDTIYREKLIHGESNKRLYEIGYRKDIVYYAMKHWRIPCDGFAEKTFDQVTQTLNLMAPYKCADTPWQWLIKVQEYDNKHGEKAFLERIEKGEDAFYFEGDRVYGKGCVYKIEDYYVMSVQVNREEHSLLLDAFIRDKEDIDKLKNWCRSIRYLHREESNQKHS